MGKNLSLTTALSFNKLEYFQRKEPLNPISWKKYTASLTINKISNGKGILPMMIATFNPGGHETRVAITPAAVRQYINLGFEVNFETNAGKLAGFHDQEYLDAGAVIIKERKFLLENADLLLCVEEPLADEIKYLPPESLLIAPVDNHPRSALLAWCLKHRISVFSLNNMPRLSRAQSMDSLSSQANLAGYCSILEGATYFNRALPMMVTAAGMINPAKILVLGAGVAGLQAIATAKRLGAVVYAFDVRAAAKEQVESLGAEFITAGDCANAEMQTDYANEVSDEYRALQSQVIDEHARQANIIICSALIPDKKAPLLLKKQTIEAMKPGSVIVDLAASRGGNCELTECDQVIKHGQITIIGYSNLARKIPATASELYANNFIHLIRFLADPNKKLSLNETDEIIQKGMLCHDGQHLPFQFAKEH